MKRGVQRGARCAPACHASRAAPRAPAPSHPSGKRARSPEIEIEIEIERAIREANGKRARVERAIREVIREVIREAIGEVIRKAIGEVIREGRARASHLLLNGWVPALVHQEEVREHREVQPMGPIASEQEHEAVDLRVSSRGEVSSGLIRAQGGGFVRAHQGSGGRFRQGSSALIRAHQRSSGLIRGAHLARAPGPITQPMSTLLEADHASRHPDAERWRAVLGVWGAQVRFDNGSHSPDGARHEGGLPGHTGILLVDAHIEGSRPGGQLHPDRRVLDTHLQHQMFPVAAHLGKFDLAPRFDLAPTGVMRARRASLAPPILHTPRPEFGQLGVTVLAPELCDGIVAEAQVQKVPQLVEHAPALSIDGDAHRPSVVTVIMNLMREGNQWQSACN